MNAYIKGSGPTVYWHASNGKRYVFPNNATYQSWRMSPPEPVTTIGDVELYTIPIGGNMTYRPGSRLVKITTDPRVYAVARYGVLRWVTSEQVARTLYGQNWAQMVDDLPDEFFANYTIGAPINSGSDYNAASEMNAAVTPSDNISAQASVGGTNTGTNTNTSNRTDSLVFSVNQNAIYSGDTLRFTATASNGSNGGYNGYRIEIRDNVRQTLVRTCADTSSCVFDLAVTQPSGSSYGQYVAYLIGPNGMEAARAYTPLITFNGYTATTEGRLDVDRTSIASGSMTVFTLTAPSNIPTENIYAEFFKENMGPMVWSCGGQRVCSASAANWSNGYASARYYALVYNRVPGQSGNGTYVATVYSPRINFTTYDVCPSSICTYAITPGPLANTNNQNPVSTLPYNTVSLTANRTAFNVGDSDRTLRLQATIQNPSINVNDLEIRIYKRNVDHDRLLQRTCTSVSQCSFEDPLYEFPSVTWRQRYTYTAEFRSRVSGQLLATSEPVVVMLNPQAQSAFERFNTMVRVAVTTRAQNGQDENVTVKGSFENPAPVGSYMIMLYDADTGALLADRGLWHEVEYTLTGRAPQTRRVLAKAQDFSGKMIQSEVITIQFSGGSVQPTFQVTSVLSTLDQSAPNRCNEGFRVIGTIMANGPGTVSYKWERSDSAITPVQTVTFTEAGTKTVTGSWFLSGNYSGWLRLHVVAPNEMNSNQTAIVSQCQAPTPTLSGSIYTSTDPGEARPGDVVRVDANLTLNQSTGAVRVEIFNQDGQGIKTCWNMSVSGFCQAYQAMIPATAQGTYSFYAQAVDGYGNRIQSNWFPVRIR